MNTLNLKLQGTSKFKGAIKIDGKAIKFKKNDFGSLICKYQTEKSEVELTIERYLELAGRLWFLMGMLFMIVSVMGIFNPWYSKACAVINYKSKIKLNETSNVTLSINNLRGEGRAIETQSDVEIEEISNYFYEDTRIRKRRKALIIINIVAWVLIIAGAITAVIVL